MAVQEPAVGRRHVLRRNGRGDEIRPGAGRRDARKLQRQQQQIEYDDIKLYQTQEAALAELHYLLAQDLSLKSQVSALTADDLKPDSVLKVAALN